MKGSAVKRSIYLYENEWLPLKLVPAYYHLSASPPLIPTHLLQSNIKRPIIPSNIHVNVFLFHSSLTCSAISGTLVLSQLILTVLSGRYSERRSAHPFIMEDTNISELVERLGSNEDAVRKMAVFKLQSNIGDPSFADIFIAEGGLTKLRNLTLHATGNTLAYSLTSFARLLEVDKGWEFADEELVERVS